MNVCNKILQIKNKYKFELICHFNNKIFQYYEIYENDKIFDIDNNINEMEIIYKDFRKTIDEIKIIKYNRTKKYTRNKLVEICKKLDIKIISRNLCDDLIIKIKEKLGYT